MTNPAIHREHEELQESSLILGFWMYILSDVLLFATLFATFAVLRNNTAGGLAGVSLFNIQNIFIETILLLTSSLTCGIALLYAHRNKKIQTIIWFTITALLGILFLKLELSEFVALVQEGNSWERSAFLSSFFTLVGTHGLHIMCGLIWIVVLIVHTARFGLTRMNIRRLQIFSIFWHFLDIIWIFIFTFVYLMSFI